MRAFYTLTPTTTSVIIGTNVELPWSGPADWIAVINPTASPILVRVTGPEIPSYNTADYIVPAAHADVLPVSSHTFGVAFATPTALGIQSAGLVARATIIVGKHEPPPAFGNFNFNSLSSSDLVNTTVKPTALLAATLGPWDIRSWGGIIVSIDAAASSVLAGSMRMAYCISADLITWHAAVSYAVWDGYSYVFQLPRLAPYVKLVFYIPGEISDQPLAQTATVFVRTSLSEILQPTAGVGGGFFPGLTVNLVANASQTTHFETMGLTGVEYWWEGAKLAHLKVEQDDALISLVVSDDVTIPTGTTGLHRVIQTGSSDMKFTLTATTSGSTGTLYLKPLFVPEIPKQAASIPVLLPDQNVDYIAKRNAIVAATDTKIFDPGVSQLNLNLLGYCVSTDTTCQVNLKYGTSAVIFDTFFVANLGAGQSSPWIERTANRLILASPNNCLWVSTNVNANIAVDAWSYYS